MLGVHVEQVAEPVVVRKGGIQVGHQDDDRQERQDHDVELVPEKHSEYALPIGVAGRGDLLRRQVIVVHMGEQLLRAEAKLTIIKFHTSHLAFSVNEIRGSTTVIMTSPRIMETTDSVA